MSNSSPVFLLIETSTEVCSVALSRGNRLLNQKISREPKAHARVVAPMVQQVLQESGITLDGCSAVVVSEGPGSYTGLRVGVSLAKGLCFGSGLPMISVGSIELLAQLALEKGKEKYNYFDFIVPMLDARRMEVYCAVYDSEAKLLSEVEAKIIDQKSFSGYLEKGVTLFCGDGAKKVNEVINHPNAIFMELDALASGMIDVALKKYKKGEICDTAYFEPFYLKDFIAGTPKKGPLG